MVREFNTSEQRRKIMQRVKSKDTGIELSLRKALWHKGIRYRKNYRKLPGTPDIAITKYKIAVFCDSEFWHGKDWESKKPRLLSGNNGEFWVSKIERNRERDEKTTKTLESMGWIVIRFWGRDIQKKTEDCIKVVDEAILARKSGGVYDPAE